MSLALIRGLSRKCYSVEQSFALAKLYSTRIPDEKPAPDKCEPPKQEISAADGKLGQYSRENIRMNIQGDLFQRIPDEKPAHEKSCPEKLTTEKPVPEKSSPEKLASEKSTPEPSSSEKLATEKPAPEKCEPPKQDTKSADGKMSQYSRENVRKNIEGYVFQRYIDYVKNYDKVLEKKFPAAMKVYHVFMDGVKDFFKDMVALLKITRIVTNSASGVGALTRKELELYYQMPRDMRKVAPVLLLSAIPFGHYVIFPLAYMYPKHLMTSHFWTLQQRNEFAIEMLKGRLEYNRKVFRILQTKLDINITDDLYDQWSHILGQLGSGLHPAPKEIIAVKDLFSRPPYNTRSMGRSHMKYLCGLHGLHRGLFKKSRLTHRAYCTHFMDRAIRREGGVHNMPVDSLRTACFFRGLNAANMTNEDLVKWLEGWVEVSVEIDSDNFSLLLHLPILLGYNHPNNWQLRYGER